MVSKSATVNKRYGTSAWARASTPRLNASVRTNSAMIDRIVLSRSKVVAMILGVSCALAIWIATRNELDVNTMNESIAATKPCKTFWTTPTSITHDQLQSSWSSSQFRNRMTKNDVT